MRHKEFARRALQVYTEWHGETEGFEYRIDSYDWGQVVSVAGTKGKGDLGIDLRVLPRWEDGVGWIAGGFWDVAADMSVVLARRTTPGVPLYIVGHSAGGAIALCVAAHLTTNGIPVTAVITFGAPRVGRLKCLDNVHVVRYRHGKDIVTYLGLRGTKDKIITYGKPSHWYWNREDHVMTKYLEKLP